MISIYRKGLRLFAAPSLVLAVAMMATTSASAGYLGNLISERQSGQAFEAGWADGYGGIVIDNPTGLGGNGLAFSGHGGIRVVLMDGPLVIADETARGFMRLTIAAAGEGVSGCPGCESLVLVERDGHDSHTVLFAQDIADGHSILVELVGSYEVFGSGVPDATFRGTLSFELTVDP